MFDPEGIAKEADTGALRTTLLLFRELLLELLPRDGFALGEFGGDVLAFEGLNGFAHVGHGHGVDVFEEGDQGDEFFVFDVAFPRLENDGVVRVLFGVRGFCVDHDYFGEVTIEVGEVLGMLACSWG